jgi:uncharacterized protein
MLRSKNILTRYVLISCGVILVIIGLIGIIVPGLPTTIFLILAAACFAESSPRLHQKLLEHPWFGPIIDNWQKNKSIPLRAKQLAILMIVLSYLYTWYSVESLAFRLLIAAMLFVVVIYLLRLPLSEESSKNGPET